MKMKLTSVNTSRMEACSMKGQTLPGKLFNMIILLAIGCAVVIAVLVITMFAGDAHKFDATVKVLYNPTKYDVALMAFLESTDPGTGVPIRDVLAAAVAQGSASYVYVDGRSVNVQSATGSLLAVILEKPFFLRSTDPELKLGGSAAGLGKSVYKTSTQVLKPDGGISTLELYVSQ